MRALLLDCAALWNVPARVTADTDAIEFAAPQGCFVIERAPAELRPVRWLLQTPERRTAGRPPRAAPSIGAALLALRHAVGGDVGNRLQVARRWPD